MAKRFCVVYLSVLLTHAQDGWQISHYQASRL
jgi:hypothetical protein